MKPEGQSEVEADHHQYHQMPDKESRVSRVISMLELFLRILAIVGTLGSAVVMGTTNETLPFSTQTQLYQAQYDDIPTFRFFVIVNGIVCAYLAVSIPVAIYHIIRTKAARSRSLLIILDAMMVVALTAGASAATAIVYLAHKGNASANWVAICQQYQSFCERVTVSLIGSFGVVLIFVVLISLSGYVLSRRKCLQH